MMQRDTKSHSLWWERKSILGWWLNLTAPPRPIDMSELSTREYVRKSELTSLVIVASLIYVVGLVSNSLSDPSTALAAGIMAVVGIISLILNRFGHLKIAAYLMTSFLILTIALSIVLAKGGLRLTWIITYDLFCVPIVVSSLIIHRNAAIVTAILCDLFVVVDFFVQPRAHILVNGFQFDEIQWEINQPFFSPWAMINRNFLLLLFIGLFSWLAAYSFEKALQWAEQTKSDSLAAFANAYEKEQIAQTVSHFLNEVVTAFTEQANGRMALLPPRVGKQDPFAPYVQLLNERLRRFEQMRRQADSWNAVQIHQAVKALSATLHKIAVGSLPIQSVAPSHFRTGVEPIDEVANQIYILLYHQTQRFSPTQ